MSGNSNWDAKITTQKGNLGESIIDRYLKEHDIIPYRAVFDGPHPFDRILASIDKKSLHIAEIKTKARRDKYPDTGIDIRSYDQYKYIAEKYHLRIFIFFVDNLTKTIYGNYLDLLEQTKQIEYIYDGVKRVKYYPSREERYGCNIIYFPLELMETIGPLSEAEAKRLNELSSGKHIYMNSPK